MSSIQEFDYAVDERRIALSPADPRSSAKMMMIDRSSGRIEHSVFASLPHFLRKGDLVVFNSSEVLRARFLARKTTGAELEGIFVSAEGDQVSVWLKGKVKEGDLLNLRDRDAVRVISRTDRGAILDVSANEFLSWLKIHGEVPLPPYIRKERQRQKFDQTKIVDQKDYQTVFAEPGGLGSIAAPTASLHFDESLLCQIKAAGVNIEFVKLHVGLGTFEPVDVDRLDQHKMHSEMVEIPLEVQRRVQMTREGGGRVIAVGTTVMRSLESGILDSRWGQSALVYETDLFIRPPYIFRAVDGLITNFHWPRSTLLVLVATFLEAQKGCCPLTLEHRWRQLYGEAFARDYRLFSYGDGMLIL